jgi:hypothetical protein
MENGSSTPGRKIAELFGGFRSFLIGKNRNVAEKIIKVFRPGILLP